MMTCACGWCARVSLSFLPAAPLLLGSALPLAAQQQVAQEEPTQDPTAEEEAEAETIARAEEEGLVRLAEDVSVTGSLIPREDLDSLAPVTSLPPEEVTYQGTARVEDLIQALPQAFASQNSTVAYGASGTATVDLRHLGSVRTLILINGRRMSAGDAWETAPDLNFIPSALVQRVDVLTGGASTVYGADAVAGVVNFIMDTEFEGVRGEIQYNAFQHDNNNATAQAINEAAGFPVRSGNIWDGGGFNANIAVGGKFADDKGHATAYIDYRNIEEIRQERRDYTNCTPRRGPDGPICTGSGVIPQGRFISFGPYWNYLGDYVLDLSTGHTFKPREGEIFSPDPYVHMQRPDRKWSGGAFARYTVNRHLEPYAEVMFMDDYTDAKIAPTANFGETFVVNCDNPMLSAQQRDLLCTQAGFGPDDYANVYTLRRSVEGGSRTSQLRHTSFRLLGGLRGDISDGWSYDLYGLHAEVSSPQSWMNDFDMDRLGEALDVIGDPDNPSTWRCRSDAAVANGCRPWNIFQVGGVTQDALDYLHTAALLNSGTKTQMVNLTVTGDLERHGQALPSASEGVQVALGAEYRKESLYLHPDEVMRLGKIASVSEMPTIDDGFNVKELFLEALIPVIQDTRGAEDLTLELGYRYAHYNLSGGNSSYKALLSWAPIGALKLRGGWNRAVRAPNAQELFRSQALSYTGSGDPCVNDPATGVSRATLEQCLRTGMSAAQYGTVPYDAGGFINVLTGGNPDLTVETADALTAGLVWTPETITGLSATIDYYDIQVDETIGSLWAEDTLRMCGNTGDPLFCDRIHRDSAGTLWRLGQGYVDVRDQNIGQLGARGFDLSASYPLNLGDWGFISFSFLGTYMLENGFTNRVAGYDCAGFYGNQCWQPDARWRHRFRASWQTSFDTTISLGWRFIGSTLIDDASDEPDLGDPDLVESWKTSGFYEIPDYDFFDLAATYSFRDGLRLTLGANNVLDTDPPLASEFYSEAGFQGMYDPLGRTIYTNLQFEF
jgi:iron complex outermembrane receptor protein